MLRAHLAADREPCATAPRIAFEQVFGGTGSHGDETAARRAALTGGADAATPGVPTMLPASVPLVPETVVASIFGPGFFAEVVAQESGRRRGALAGSAGGGR